MKDFTSMPWNELKKHIAAKFAAGLGEGRVRSTDKGILLLFNLNDKVQMEEFNHFGTVAYETGIRNTANMLPDNLVEIRIPGEHEEPGKLLMLAERMAIPFIRRADTETVRRIGRADPEHIIASVTKVPWNLVEGTAYGKVLEPVQAVDITDELRKKQEFGVGYVLREEGKASREIAEWLAHQREVEHRDGLKPRTVLPVEWASKDGIDRAKKFNREYENRPLTKLFPRM